MFGFVVSPRVVATVAGVEPLSRLKVVRIKALTWVGAAVPQIILAGIPLAGTVGFIAGAVVDPQVRVLFAAMAVISAVATGTLINTFRRPWNHPRWETCSYDRWELWSHRGVIPFRVRFLARDLTALGFQPHVDYLDDDPFLFVIAAGRRVYLAHWR